MELLAGLLIMLGLRRVAHAIENGSADGRYWKGAYENLVAQTGRDLNDGLGKDPRKEVRQ